MRTVTVYEYDELPTDAAKARAREWWTTMEAESPAWIEDHGASMNAAIEAASKLNPEGETLTQLKDRAERCEFTGYCADALLADLITKLDRLPTEREIRDHYHREWDEELQHTLTDEETIADNIRANSYEFTADGTRVRA